MTVAAKESRLSSKDTFLLRAPAQVQHYIKHRDAIMNPPLLAGALSIDKCGDLLKARRFGDQRYDVAVLVRDDDLSRHTDGLQWASGRTTEKNRS